jgi:hypothetical protein
MVPTVWQEPWRLDADGLKSAGTKAGAVDRIRRLGHLRVNAMANKTSRKSAKTAAQRTAARKPAPKPRSREAAKPALLAGGNPQVAKGYGDVPVQAYIAAMPGWKREIGHRLDALIARTVPGVRMAVKWNSPFYGSGDEKQGWFLSFHCYAKYVKVAFFRGASLHPVPPGASKHKDVRYLDINEGELDEAQFSDWVKQASLLPGERLVARHRPAAAPAGTAD